MIRVVVVEDDRAAMDITCRYVEKVEGFSVVGKAFDGDEAEAMVARLNPDLIILDIDIPGKNGADLLEELRKQGNHARALFLTAASDADIMARAFSLGIVDYLVKPIGFEQFKNSLCKCLLPV